jgi:hypothetical protein
MIQSFSAAMARSTVTYIHSQCRRLAGRRASSKKRKFARCRATKKRDVDAATDPEEKQERKGVDGGVFKSTGRYNASPTSMWRALTEYESLYNTSDAIVTCKRLWISSRVGCSVIRLQSRDDDLLWGSVRATVVVKIQENLTEGEIYFEAFNEGEKNDFSLRGYVYLLTHRTRWPKEPHRV